MMQTLVLKQYELGLFGFAARTNLQSVLGPYLFVQDEDATDTEDTDTDPDETDEGKNEFGDEEEGTEDEEE